MSNTRAQGSYFRNDFNAISGLGDDRSLSFADQTLLGIVQAQPTLTYTEWASQSGDVVWNETVATQNYQAFAITDQQIVATATVATSVPDTLAVISPFLSFGTQVGKAFEKTPYAYQKTEAIYAQLDPASPPQIYFLYWLSLRSATDPKIGNISLNFAAVSIGGVLTYILEVPQTGQDRARPSMRFTQALALQQGRAGVSVPATPAQQATRSPGQPQASILQAPASSPVPAASAALAPTAGDKGKAVVLVGLGAAAAIAAYQWFSRRAS